MTTPSGSNGSKGLYDVSQELSVITAQVEDTLARGFRWLRFPEHLENFFERETSASRSRHLIIGGLVAILTYDLFLLSDYTMIPDVFRTAVIVRLGVVTPLTILIMIALYRGMPPVLRESIEAVITVFAGASIVYFLALSEHPNAAYYHTGLILVITFGNIVVRLRFWYAVVASLTTVLIYLIVNPVLPDLPIVVQVNNVIVLCSSVVFTLFANYTLEQDHRRSYLLSLRERIRRAELTAHNVELTRLSHIDPLTGIANRRELGNYLDQLLQDPGLDTIGIAMFDVDHFKLYNDLYGHLAGDECLRRVAEVLRKSLRHSSDMVARFGGEEFVIVLPGSNLYMTMQIAERIRKAVLDLAIPHAASPISAIVTVSAGVATASMGNDVQTIFNEADAALYRAKSAGRNCTYK